MAQTNGPLRVAISGCHRMLTRPLAGHNWASAFDAVSETEMVAVFDLEAETRAAFVECWGDIPTYDDYPRMLREVEPDIVCIATRQTMHAEQFEQALAAGVRGILSDKPLATSLDEADRIVDGCRRVNVPLAFGLDRRWDSSYRFLRQVIADGSIGAVTSVTGYGLPNLINHGCHWYDAMLALAGDPEPTWVSGFVNDISDEPPDSRSRMDPTGRAQIGLDNGALAVAMPEGGPGAGFEVLGKQGRLLILNDARQAYLWTETSDGGRAELQPRPLELPPVAEDWPAGPATVSNLAQAVRTGGTTACDVGHARRATEIGFAVHLSSNSAGARVSLPATDRLLRIPSYPWGNE